MSKIKVNSIEASTGSTVTLPSGQTLDLSSGTVTLPNSSVNLTTKVTGTLPVANGGTGLTTLGSATQVLRVNSGATALEFATAPAGKVLQVVHTNKTTVFTTSSGSFVDVTGLTATITPSSASSKILLLSNVNLSSEDNSGGLLYVKFVRNINGGSFSNLNESTDARTGTQAHVSRECAETSTHISVTRHNILLLDSPNTTSACIYKAQASTNGSNTLVIGASGRSDTNSSDAKFGVDIILMEIGA